MKILKTKIDMCNIMRYCENFRNAIEIVGKEQLNVTFQSFPKGSCGSTSLILGAYLEEQGYGKYNYICGKYHNQHHAWLEKDGIIVDLTSDQFQWGKKIYIGKETDMYKLFVERTANPYTTHLTGGSIQTDRLYSNYKIICTEIENQSE